jgi:hypothetical protein
MPAPTIRHEFTQGYGGSAITSGGTIPDLSGNGNTGIVNNMTATSNWLGNFRGGMLDLNNTTNTSGKTIQCANITHQNDYSIHIGIQTGPSGAMVGFPCIICGAYNGGGNDWWLGWNTSGEAMRYARNQVSVISSSSYGNLSNTFYMVALTNDFTGGGAGSIFKIYRANGTDGATATGGPYAASTAGRVGICKYGGWTDNFQSAIRLGHFMFWNGSRLTEAEHDDIARRYYLKYGFTALI